MADVDNIINYIKSLRKGFDKDLFQHNIDELAYAVDTSGLDYDDFHTLFKIWLNLSIPMTKWVNLGICLAPPDIVEERTVLYALRWILANIDETKAPRVGFLLDWLTGKGSAQGRYWRELHVRVAMESESIDMTTLDYGYEIFNTMLTFESLKLPLCQFKKKMFEWLLNKAFYSVKDFLDTVHAIKLVYTLTKPVDVTRRRVLEIFEFAQKREGKKAMYRQLQVLLGLFKSYKPECVPENVPAISIHSGFKKLNLTLLTRFRRIQERRNRQRKERKNLMWINPINSDRSRNKKAEPLVPNIQFVNRTNNYEENATSKNCLDFPDPVSLIHYCLRHDMMRPARLRALLCNMAGQMLLATNSSTQHAFFMHDLENLLNNCFFEVSPYSYGEKQDLLQRLAQFQQTLLQGIPAVTAFLAQYLPFWNEKDFFPEILDLCEWVSIECPTYVQHIASSLHKCYLRAQPIEQCAILRTVTSMYCNLVYASTKCRHHFLDTPPSPDKYPPVLSDLAGSIAEFSDNGLQVNPEDMRVLYSAIWSAKRRAHAELRHGGNIGALPTTIALGLPLVNVSAALLDNIAELLILYNRIMSSKGTRNEDHADTLNKYMLDLLNCLYTEEAITDRKTGLIFDKLHPQLVGTLEKSVPDIDAKLSIRNHVAFAPYNGIYFTSIESRQSDNEALFHSTIDKEFANLGKFLKKAHPDLRRY